MAYLLALLYLVGVYVRPGEIVSGWEGFPFMQIVAALAVVAVLGSLMARPRRFWNQPQDRYVLGYFAAMIVSNPAWGWFFGGYLAALKMAPVVFCYFLLRSAIESPAQLRRIGSLVVALTVFQACIGMIQFETGVGLGNVVALDAGHGEQEPSDSRRIRGTGIFNDPNDLALALAVVVPFLLGPIATPGTRMTRRISGLVLLVPVISALFYTNSRGGILGLGAALFVSLYSRFGKVFGPVLAVVGVAALLMMGPSRLAEMDSKEASAQGRIQSWSQGLTMFRSRPLFGVGFGRYTDFNSLVAHNSFVHTLGELGLFGAFFFIGMGYWFFYRAPQPEREKELDPELIKLQRWRGDLWHSGIAFAVCATFLSQQYSVLLFVWIALSACYRQLSMVEETAPSTVRISHPMRIGTITFVGIVSTYGIVRLLSNWSG